MDVKADGQNQQYVTPPFGMSAAGVSSTGATGNPTALPTQDSANLMTGVIVSVPGQSSQVSPDLATVHVGDSATPSFGPTPPDGDPLTGLPGSFLNATGAGEGSTHDPHPNSAARRPS